MEGPTLLLLNELRPAPQQPDTPVPDAVHRLVNECGENVDGMGRLCARVSPWRAARRRKRLSLKSVWRSQAKS